MRFELQSFGDAMVAPARGAQGREEWEKWTEAAPDLPPAARPARIGRRRSVAAATSRMVAHVVEGFAASAAALYPDLFNPRRDHVNGRDVMEDPQIFHGVGRLSALQGGMPRSALAQSLEKQVVVNGLIDIENARQLKMGGTGSGGLRAGLMSVWSRIRVAHERRKASAELAALDDRMLKDIGISRHEIDGVVRHGRR
jgi:uncharacterized protein YjiS (DUF1127 family)